VPRAVKVGSEMEQREVRLDYLSEQAPTLAQFTPPDMT
jgi:hypothetical protein